MDAIENLKLTSLFDVKRVRKKLFLIEQNEIEQLENNIRKIGSCRMLMSPRYNITTKLRETFLGEAVDCLKTEFFYSNLSFVIFRKLQLDAGENHPDLEFAYDYDISYIFSIYSHLTVEPEMAIPRNPESCVHDAKFYKLGSEHDVNEVFSRMRYQYDEVLDKYVISNSTHPLLKLLSENIYMVQLLVVKNDFDYMFSTSPPYQIKLLHNHNNTVYAEQLCLDNGRRRDNYQNYETLSCRSDLLQANKFVYIYNFPFNGQNFKEQLDFFATILFGGKRAFGNNHPSMFNTLKGWAGAADFSSELADEIVGKLEESGILMRWRTLEIILFLLKSWKGIQLNIFGAHFSNISLVKVAYDLIEDMSLQEYTYETQVKALLEGVRNDELTIVWILFGLGCGINVLVFLVEMMYCN
ncbi:unnamed protein product [Orchesella dallaii]|uniref:Uncharacterized protein n=1 Tax=Orchesella dallaii TaxID=48710 RepID=A0ABP1QVP0_9HEXA